MLLFIYKKMGLGEVKPTIVKLQLANMLYIFSNDKIENILVKVDKFNFLINFVILDM